MTDIQRYDQGAHLTATAGAQPPTELDQWVTVVRDISKLAGQIADTPFVPEEMRGNPAAVTAAILTGREMGLGPMTSLQHIHVVKGKPGKSAEIMRGMVLAAGHHIRDVEVTDTRVVIEGRRRDEETWTRVGFTADQAKKARIDLGGYPEDKLYARATTRLCRRKFADVVGGISATIEELEEGEIPDAPGATSTPVTAAEDQGISQDSTTPKRTAQRRTGRKKDQGKTTTPSASGAGDQAQSSEADPQTAQDDGAPPLPGDEPTRPPEHDQGPMSNADDGASREQLTKLHAQLGDLGIDDRADKLTTVGLLVQRQLSSSQDLTHLEAKQAMDILARVLNSDEPQRSLDAVLGNLETPAQEQ